MDKTEKALRKLSPKEREALRGTLRSILAGEFARLDIKKLKGAEKIFRVRKGNMRIIYQVNTPDDISILAVERRSDTTYHF